jgi:uncharacterized MAPEG superfamily protein
MHPEILWLNYTLILTALMAFPYVIDRIAVRGIIATISNPSSTDLPQHEWAQRAQRAHANAIENLVVFAAAVLAVALVNLGNSATLIACQIYFYARLIHYVAYALGIPGIRTLAYFAGWGATAVLLVKLLGIVQ